MKKKFISVLLSALIIFGVMPFGAFTVTAETEYVSGYYTYTVSNGEARIVSCDTSISGEVTVPSTLGGYPVTEIGYMYAFSGCENMTSIIIPESVKKIGLYTFNYCTSLVKIALPDGLLSIGSDAFLNSAYYKDESNWENDALYIGKHLIAIKETVSGEYKIKEGTRCIGGSVFEDCTELTAVEIPDTVTAISFSAFRDCSGLKNITIPDSVVSIENDVFYGCTSLESITLPFVGGSVDNKTHFGYIFGAYDYDSNNDHVPRSLKTVILSDKCESIRDYSFMGCVNIENIVFSGTVKNIAKGVFSDTAYYKNEDNWQDGVLYISNHLIEFKESVVGSYKVKEGTKAIADNAFENFDELTKVTLPEGVESIGEYAFYDCNSLITVSVPETVKYIGDCAFRYCESLTKVNIPNGIKRIGNGVFSDCRSLSEIIIPDGVESIGNATFEYCYAISELKLPSGLKEIGNFAFERCISITNINIPDTVISVGEGAFRNCSLLKEISLPESVENLGASAFAYCRALESAELPKGITSIEYETFYNCSELKSIAIPESVTSIGRDAFGYCNSLDAVYITDISKWCGIVFENMTANPMYNTENIYVNNQIPTEIAIPDNTEVIGAYQFFDFSALESIFIPSSVVLIKLEAFHNCVNLKNVYYEGDFDDWAEVTPLNGNECLADANIYYNCTEIPESISSVEITKLPQKLEYIENEEELDLTGGILTVKYANGSSLEIDLATLSFEGFDNSELGEQVITVKYGKYVTSFKVEVISRPISFIAIAHFPEKTDYIVGEELDLTGGKLAVCYIEGNYIVTDITADMITGFESDTVGSRELTVCYKGHTTKFTVNIFSKVNPDLDGDGKVTASDAVVLRNAFLNSDISGRLQFDINGDGKVDARDIVNLKSRIASY